MSLESLTSYLDVRALYRRRRTVIAVAVWATLIAIYWQYTDQAAPTAEAKIHLLADLFLQAWWGPILFIFFFALQPLVFFPSFLLGLVGGILYGPMWGIIYVVLGANAAASVTYGAGRLIGDSLIGEEDGGNLLRPYVQRLRTNTFETVLVLHLLVVIPFDIVNYAAGFLRLNWRQFALATALGTIPGVIAFVLFGRAMGTLDNLAAGKPSVSPTMLLLSIGMASTGFLLSRFIRRVRATRYTEQGHR